MRINFGPLIFLRLVLVITFCYIRPKLDKMQRVITKQLTAVPNEDLRHNFPEKVAQSAGAVEYTDCFSAEE